jgi:hypothetical protein
MSTADDLKVPDSIALLKADVFKYAAELSAKTGVEIDPEKMWDHVQERIAK